MKKPSLMSLFICWEMLSSFAHYLDNLRVSKTKMHTESNTSVSKEPHPCGSPQPDELADLLQAMEELDAPENTPKCLSPAVWERFCLFRRTKVESEHKVTRVVANA